MAFVFTKCERCHGHRRESTDDDDHTIMETHEGWCMALTLLEEHHQEEIESLQSRVSDLEETLEDLHDRGLDKRARLNPHV